ncbi:MAG: hypothetical protein KDA41_00875, partial [Planctomycetales bacterium]|nr:hypothetical protein [Planctomycetales bacterium]
YDRWPTNASWLAMVEFTRQLPAAPEVITRLYDVDFQHVRQRLEEDLVEGLDFALHVGQAPGSTRIQLESIGINVGGHSRQLPDDFQPLAPEGPAAYQSGLPLARLAQVVRGAGIPAQVSYHAGTYLCNATLYLAHHIIAERKLSTKAAFVHLPLDISQVMEQEDMLPSLPAAQSAAALRLIVEHLCENGSAT